MVEYDALIGFAVLLVTVLVPFGIAMIWLGVTKNRLNTMEKDIYELKKDVKNLTNRVDTHIEVMNILTQMGIIKGGEVTKK